MKGLKQDTGLLWVFLKISQSRLCSHSTLWPMVSNFCSWQVENLSIFLYKACSGYHGFHKFRSLGSLQYFLDHSLANCHEEKLMYFFSINNPFLIFYPTAGVGFQHTCTLFKWEIAELDCFWQSDWSLWVSFLENGHINTQMQGSAKKVVK